MQTKYQLIDFSASLEETSESFVQENVIDMFFLLELATEYFREGIQP